LLVVNDSLDDILDESGDEEEQDAVVSQVLDEIGIEISGKVCVLVTLCRQLALKNRQRVRQPVNPKADLSNTRPSLCISMPGCVCVWSVSWPRHRLQVAVLSVRKLLPLHQTMILRDSWHS